MSRQNKQTQAAKKAAREATKRDDARAKKLARRDAKESLKRGRLIGCAASPN